MARPLVDGLVTRADLPANASPSRGGSAKPWDSAGVSQVVFDAHAIHFRVEPLRGRSALYTEVVHDEVLESAPVPGRRWTRRGGRIGGRTGRGARRGHGRDRNADDWRVVEHRSGDLDVQRASDG